MQASLAEQNVFRTDITQWPIIVATYPRVVTKGNIDSVLAGMRQLFARSQSEGVHLATIADMRPVQLEKVPAEIGKYLVTNLSKIDEDFPGLAVCDAAVVTSPLLRIAINTHARFRLKRNHITRSFSTMQEAHALAELTLRSHRPR